MEKVTDKIYYYMDGSNLKIEEIMEKYNNYIYTILNNSNIKFSKEDEEEILLDVYLTLWNNKEKLDINKSMSAYMGGITKNLILKKFRGNKKVENIDEYIENLAGNENVEYEYLCSQENHFLIEQLEKLKKQDKEIFILYYYEERKIREIALMYKMTESKVKSKLFRIRKKLKKFLKEGGYDFDG